MLHCTMYMVVAGFGEEALERQNTTKKFATVRFSFIYSSKIFLLQACTLFLT